MVKALKAFRGGIRPGHHKSTSGMETVEMSLPSKVIIPMLQHVGTPCIPIVKKGDRVLVGQKIGDSDKPISSPVHSSVSGTVTDVRPLLLSTGTEVMAVEIKPDGLQEAHGSVRPPECRDRESLVKCIRDAGLVGLGGAGFPTAVKLTPPPGKNIDILLINGAECEPYITSDFREMMENPGEIIEGTKRILEISGAKKAFICIESNKPEAILKLNELLRGSNGISVVPLRTRYPQGGEKQLIYAVTGRQVPSGKLPSDVGVLVQNVGTASFIAEFLKTGMPLVKKKITVDGGAVTKPMNLEVLVGTPLREVFDFCGGFKKEPCKIIMGGPMMGVAQFSLDTPVLKQNNALLALTEEEAAEAPESVCIHCGKCVAACPMSLLPLYINSFVNLGRFDEVGKYHVNDCIECGCCSYVCPASRHLVQSVRYAKAELRKLEAHKKAEAQKQEAQKLEGAGQNDAQKAGAIRAVDQAEAQKPEGAGQAEKPRQHDTNRQEDNRNGK
ncbi:MAG TPA: electron transport complex subunit RsxC [Clostridia bacterium]|nr:electron transport complex subunit RsxC [Clostridia bacterium]